MAQGVIDIVNAKMADAIRTITIQRGIDPREFSLVAFGGAGPSQAAALAEELEISEVIVPVHPGAFSAWGMLQTDVRHDFKETLYSFWDMIEAETIDSAFAALRERGRAYLAEEGITGDRVAFERAIDFRYHGQEYVLTIALDDGPIDMDKVRADFDAAYQRQYGHNSPENRVEMANIRLAALGRLERPRERAARAGNVAPSTRTRGVVRGARHRPPRCLTATASARATAYRAPPSSRKSHRPPFFAARLDRAADRGRPHDTDPGGCGMSQADPITTEVVRNFVISCAEDMNASLWRSAHSAIIYEGKDSAVALMDERGNMLGQSTGVPLFIGAIDVCVRHVQDYYGDDIHEGDIFIMNDSYMQGTHLHDVTAIGPIFHEGELVGFGAARAHWNDIGAMDPGSTMSSTNIYQEGLRLGPTRIVSRGKRVREWYDHLKLNTRLGGRHHRRSRRADRCHPHRRAASWPASVEDRDRDLPRRLPEHIRAGTPDGPRSHRRDHGRNLEPRRLSGQ